jgi:hydroxymethylpyrimidine pyrophosphatase-like HAD family hydrolase
MAPSALLPLANYQQGPRLRYFFADIDGTMTLDGRLPANVYTSLWELMRRGIALIPVTGRPAGWCEMIARFWPVHSVIGENGGFYFSYQNQQMRRRFSRPEADRARDRAKLEDLCRSVLQRYPRAAMASDQFCRLCDVAVDFCEDVVPPLSAADAVEMQRLFTAGGAVAKISSIHVNAWFGDYDKLSMCRLWAREQLGAELDDLQEQMVFVGDSPNDEPMFAYFRHAFGVGNIRDFADSMKHLPRYLADAREGDGFCQVVRRILADTV